MKIWNYKFFRTNNGLQENLTWAFYYRRKWWVVALTKSPREECATGKVYRALPTVNKRTYKEFEIEFHYIYKRPAIDSVNKKWFNNTIEKFKDYLEYCDEVS